MFGISGQSSTSSSSQTTVSGGGVNGSNSGNETDNSIVQTVTADNGGIASTAGITVNQTDRGLLDTAGQIVGAVVAASRQSVETALSLVGRVVESGFGSANRSTDIIAQTSRTSIDQVATANGRPTQSVFDRYGLWIVGAVLLLVGLVIVRKGKA